jgi:histidinol dehydrogenase
VAWDPTRQALLVGSTRHVTVSVVRPDGQVRTLVSDQRMVSTFGLRVDAARNRLLVAFADIGVGERTGPGTFYRQSGVGIFDLRTGAPLHLVDLAIGDGRHGANDLALDWAGNAYVTAAKLLVASRVRIDLPAGPSEVVVIADASASAVAVAADLLAQAEHGEDSDALLLTDDAKLARFVEGLVSAAPNVAVERVDSLDEALARSEAYAPEHLELHVTDPNALLDRVRNAGSVFVGCSSVVGDYAAGATHVLPTGGLARSMGGLGLETFLKPLQVVRASADGARRAADIVGPLARVEGLPLHAAAVPA